MKVIALIGSFAAELYQQPDQNSLISTQSRQDDEHAKSSSCVACFISLRLRALALKSNP